MITESLESNLAKVRRRVHRDCVVCSYQNEQGLHLDFRTTGDGEVTADFIYDKSYQGYPGLLHGGVLSAILDGAMTNCLFARDCIALTADFRIRFRHPVIVSQTAGVRAWITRTTPPIFEVKAEITQAGRITTTATAKFMQKPK